MLRSRAVFSVRKQHDGCSTLFGTVEFIGNEKWLSQCHKYCPMENLFVDLHTVF
jgi:hypothetical protein